MLKRLILRALKPLLDLIPDQPSAVPASAAEPARKVARGLPVTFLCPTCNKPVAVRSLDAAWCVNPACVDLMDVCSITFVMVSRGEAERAQ